MSPVVQAAKEIVRRACLDPGLVRSGSAGAYRPSSVISASRPSHTDATKLRMANNREYSDGRENTNQGVTLEWEILRAGCLAWMALAVEHHRQSAKSFLVPSSD